MNIKLHSPLKLGVALVIVGMLFRIQHWEYANQILISGILVMVLGYGYDLFRKEKRGVFDFIKMGLVVLMAIGYVANLLHRSIPPLLAEAAYYAFWGFLLLVGWEFLTRGKQGTEAKITAVVYGVSVCLILVGVVFKIQHWEGGTALIIGGTVLSALWVLLSPYLGKKR